ncbi:hypothetical protein D7Y27_13350 [Corallococcus sp. AB004]|nr:hypothetical protein D7Y04_14520 [Corallococcus sp. AB038B]RKI44564.1 hypothetical protein D7Y27_13350 [Corallococcus sp. AB004]
MRTLGVAAVAVLSSIAMTVVVAFGSAVSAAVLLALVGCGSATVGGGGSPARAKWVSPIVTTPDGGQLRTCYAPGGKWLTPGPERPYAD